MCVCVWRSSPRTKKSSQINPFFWYNDSQLIMQFIIFGQYVKYTVAKNNSSSNWHQLLKWILHLIIWTSKMETRRSFHVFLMRYKYVSSPLESSLSAAKVIFFSCWTKKIFSSLIVEISAPVLKDSLWHLSSTIRPFKESSVTK